MDRKNKKLGVVADTRSAFEKLGELHHSHLTGVTAPYNFKIITQNLWPHYTQRNQDGSSACTDFSSATVCEANTGVIMSARPPYANRPNKPQEGAIPSVTAALWMHPGTTTEALCPSDGLSEGAMNTPFVGPTPLTIQNYVVIDHTDINALANAIETYKAICIDLNVSWEEWNTEEGVPEYISNAVIDGGHQMAAILPLEWDGQPAIMAQQSWGDNDPDSVQGKGWVVFTEDFIKERFTGALAYIFRPATPTIPTVTITRQKDNGVETLGALSLPGFNCDILERPWLNNQINISCIPKGNYHCVWTFMPRLNEYHYLVQNVPGRSGIFIHEGNYYTNCDGCILVGNSIADINGDKQLDVINSRVTLGKFEALMAKRSFNLVIL